MTSPVLDKDDLPRCHWCVGDPVMIAYHDREWGVPVSKDDAYFERMALEVFQAGLSWRTILYKRDAFRSSFEGFSVSRIASYGPREVEHLMADAGIVRNRLKIEATIENARRFQQLQATFGSFHNYLWELSNDLDQLCQELQRQFRFMGPKIATSFLESVARVAAPHDPGCWRALKGHVEGAKNG